MVCGISWASHESGRAKKEFILSLLRAPFVLREKKYGAMEKENLPLSFLEEQVRETIQFPCSQAWKKWRAFSLGNWGFQTRTLQCPENKICSAETSFLNGQKWQRVSSSSSTSVGPCHFQFPSWRTSCRADTKWQTGPTGKQEVSQQHRGCCALAGPARWWRWRLPKGKIICLGSLEVASHTTVLKSPGGAELL